MSFEFRRFIDRFIGGFLVWLIGLIPQQVLTDDEAKNARSVLILRFWTLGESIHALPMFVALKKWNPEILCVKDNFPIFEGYAHKKHEFRLDLKGMWWLFKNYNKWDVVLDHEPYCNISALLAWWLGKKSIGWNHASRALLYNFKVPFDRSKHMVKNGLDLCVPFNKYLVYQSNLPFLQYSKRAKKKIIPFVMKGFPRIVLCPSVGLSSKMREWSLQHWSSLISRVLYEFPDAQLFLVGRGNADAMLNEQLRLNKNVTDLTNKLSLEELFALIDFCNVLVGCDSGWIHLASATHCGIVGLYGPNSPEMYAPYGERDNIHVLYLAMECSPCILPSYGTLPKKCWRFSEPKCMTGISPEIVFAEVKECLLKN